MFSGSIPALITPFNSGELDLKTLEELVKWHIDEGSNGLVAVGTTGESPTLSHAEHRKVVETVVKTAAGQIPIIAGAGSNSTSESLELIKFAGEIGADGALVVTPYYNKPNQRGLVKHYTMLNDYSNIPIIIYNIPGRSVIDMNVETMAELSKLKNIVGVKDATGDVGRVSDIRMACGEGFVQLCGNDDIALGFNAHGGVGCISVIANIAPKLSARFQDLMLKKDFTEALKLQDKLMPLHRAAFLEPNPCPTKFAMEYLGKCSSELRAPLVEIDETNKEKVIAALRHANLID
ncbi:MAG: 4-hydroxy-tetrahydrodipicolinate synthase [Pseudomonadota bacterium]|nr:4-hydroxy-tetrahydrodipicolinate synthase [Pseudomonadota bacterium]